MATAAGGTGSGVRAPRFLAGRSQHQPPAAGRSSLAGPQAQVVKELVMPQAYRTLRVTKTDEGVLSVVIDAPPMNLIGPELVRDLVTLIGELQSGQPTRVVVLESADP